MKKNLLLIFFLFFTLKIFACRCSSENIVQEYLDADFVGVITITKTFDENILKYKSGSENYFYKAEMNFDKIIKGKKLNFLNVFGIISDKKDFYQGCSLYLKPGEKYFVILKKNQNNEYWISSCSRIIRLSYHNLINEENRLINSYTKLFENIEKYKNQFSNLKFEDFYDSSETRMTYPYTPHTDFIKLNISNPYDRIGIYKVLTNKDLKIKKIIPIKQVGEKDIEIENLILKNLQLYKYGKRNNKSNKSLLLLYFDDLAPLEF
ncbi:hypothetical protein [Chryseobacterium gwangjuense]|uniref:hypothetical protein n=1 Tax=Chryseobacterium gwangjuense TaxID=1069980 RepID=UPI001E38E3EF|nr:hypothetical protein [Chryseobacterium gwangjuense]MCE3075935.1 hypothetical protein [Chryseobacterium gwangjuense]